MGVLHGEFVRLLFLQAHQETDRFFPASGVQLPEPDRGQFHSSGQLDLCVSTLLMGSL